MSFFLFSSSVISNVSYSRLRICCLIHTPLSPLSVCQPPRRGTVRHPYPIFRDSPIFDKGLLLVDRGTCGERARRDPPKGVPPKKPLFPHPKSTTSLGINSPSTKPLPAQRVSKRSHPRKNGAFLLGDGLRKIASRDQ